jgi:hypothetical protein
MSSLLVPSDCYDLRSFGALAWKVATLLLLKAWKALLVRLFIACFFSSGHVIVALLNMNRMFY